MCIIKKLITHNVQTAVNENGKEPLKMFVADVQTRFNTACLKVIDNQPSADSTFAIVMFVVEHVTLFNALHTDASTSALQTYVTSCGSRIASRAWMVDSDIREAATVWMGSSIKINRVPRLTKKLEAKLVEWEKNVKEGDEEPTEMTMLSIARLRHVIIHTQRIQYIVHVFYL